MKRRVYKRLAAILLSAVLLLTPSLCVHAEDDQTVQPPASEETPVTVETIEDNNVPSADPVSETPLGGNDVPETPITGNDASGAAAESIDVIEDIPASDPADPVVATDIPVDGNDIPAAAPAVPAAEPVDPVPVEGNAVPEPAADAVVLVTEDRTEPAEVMAPAAMGTRSVLMTAAPADTENVSSSAGTDGSSGEGSAVSTRSAGSEAGYDREMDDSDQIIMSDYDGSDVSLVIDEAKKVIVSGMNKLGSLISNAVVTIAGSGILQVDEITLRDEGRLVFESDPETGGSAAVFEKDETAEKTTYTMINGDVTGIINDPCTIPGDENYITYIIPSGAELKIVSTDTDAGCLTLPERFDLILEDGSTISGNGKIVSSSYSCFVYIDSTSALQGDVIWSDSNLIIMYNDKDNNKIEKLRIADSSVDFGCYVDLKQLDILVKNDDSKNLLSFSNGGQLDKINISDDKGHLIITRHKADPELKSYGEAENYTGPGTIDIMVSLSTLPAHQDAPVEVGNTGNAQMGDNTGNDGAAGSGGSGSNEQEAPSGSGNDEPTVPNGAEGNDPVTPISPGPSAATSKGNVIAAGEDNEGETSANTQSSSAANAQSGFTSAYDKVASGTMPEAYVNSNEGFTTEFEAPEEWTQLYGNKWKSGPLFVVFRGPDRKLKAFLAEYDPQTGKLTFKSNMAGNYVVVYYPYQDEGVIAFSDAFYSRLEQMEAVKIGLPLLLMSR